jgi:NAD(P)-dependent dehydrogenase (short-subunit alcohol dehydrogenase family)
MSSTSGTIGNPGQANYGAAKDGIAALTRVVARELGKYGITVNAVCPGAATRMTQTVGDGARQARQKAGIQTPAAQTAFTLAHTGPENVAPWVAWLASDAAKDVNGQVFFVMGGLIALMNEPAPVRTIFHDGRWTPEEIATVFSRTFGVDLVNPAPPAAKE